MIKNLKFILLLIIIVDINSYKQINFNTIIKKPIKDTIINFVKIKNIKNLRIKNHNKYLILKFNDNNNYNNSFNNIINIIKLNDKPLIIIYNNDINNLKSKYIYIINNINEYFMKYQFHYNNKKYKYLFNIKANELDKYETLWNITSYIEENDKINIREYYIKKWIDYLIYQNNNIYIQYILLLFLSKQ